MKGRKDYPCEEVEPESFITNEEVKKILKKEDKVKLTQEDYNKVYNCVHCNECGTSPERMELEFKFLNDGNKAPDNEEVLKNFRQYQTPYPTDQMRIKPPEGIPKDSDTLFFMGCLSTIRLWKYTEHALEYLLKRGVDFTIVEKEICCGYPLAGIGELEEFKKIIKKNVQFFNEGGYKKIICLCPACYYVFREDYPDMGIQFEFISDYIEPTEQLKTGRVSVQHLCQLMNRGKTGAEKEVNSALEKSGYVVENVPHWCCGGGTGYVNRTDIIDKIAEKRMKDFKGDFYTTYCPGCYWVMRSYKKFRNSKEMKLKDLFELLL